MTGGGNVGALVGYVDGGVVASSYSSGSVSESGYVDDAGGLAGGNQGTIENCSSTAAVSGVYVVGGLVGANQGTVEMSYATGPVDGGNDSQSVGGLVGVNYGTVKMSYASGMVTGGSNSYEVGGLIGANEGTVETSYSTNEVTSGSGSQAVGGLAGMNFGTVETTYTTEAVTAGSGSTDVGGLVGDNNGGTVETSYWATNVGGQNATLSTVGVNTGTIDGNTSGNTLANLEQQATFMPAGTDVPNWDFVHTWTTSENTNTPQLMGLPATSLPVPFDTLSGTAYVGSGVTLSMGTTIDLIYDGSQIGFATTSNLGTFSFEVPSTDLTGGILLTDPADKGNTFYQANSPTHDHRD
jgi:hypothetical protein